MQQKTDISGPNTLTQHQPWTVRHTGVSNYSKIAAKNPTVMKELIGRAKAAGHSSSTLSSLVDAIVSFATGKTVPPARAAEIIPFPRIPSRPITFTRLGAVAAQSGVIAIAEPQEPGDAPISLDSAEHMLMAVGKRLSWLSSVCRPGDVLVVNTTEPADAEELAVVWDNHQFWAGWLRKSENSDENITLLGDPGSNFEKEFTKAACTVFDIGGVFFDETPPPGDGIFEQVAESSAAVKVDGYITIDVGRSAEPHLFAGDILFVKKPEVKSDLETSSTYLKGRPVVLELSSGELVFKIIGDAIQGSDGKARILENIGGGESQTVRFSNDVPEAFRDLPLVEQVRIVCGCWFVGKRRYDVVHARDLGGS